MARIARKQLNRHQLKGALYYIQAPFYAPTLGPFSQGDTFVPYPNNHHDADLVCVALNVRAIRRLLVHSP